MFWLPLPSDLVLTTKFSGYTYLVFWLPLPSVLVPPT